MQEQKGTKSIKNESGKVSAMRQLQKADLTASSGCEILNLPVAVKLICIPVLGMHTNYYITKRS